MRVGGHALTTGIVTYFIISMMVFSLSLALIDSTNIEMAQQLQSSDSVGSSAAPPNPVKESVVLSDSSGPVIHDVPAPGEQRGVIHDIVIYGPTNITLNLTVTVTDPDGVSVVICSYKNASVDNWMNVTMTPTGIADQYTAEGPSFTLDADHRNADWDVRYLASDTTGNWTESGIITHFYHAWPSTENSTSPQTDETPSDLTGLMMTSSLIAGVVVIAVVLLVFIRRR